MRHKEQTITVPSQLHWICANNNPDYTYTLTQLPQLATLQPKARMCLQV